MQPHSGQQLFAKLVARSQQGPGPSSVAGPSVTRINSQKVDVTATEACFAHHTSTSRSSASQAYVQGRQQKRGRQPQVSRSPQVAQRGTDADYRAVEALKAPSSPLQTANHAGNMSGSRASGEVKLPPSLVALIPPKYRHAAQLGTDPVSLAKWREERRRRFPTAAVRAAAAAKALEASNRGEYTAPRLSLKKTQPVYPGRAGRSAGLHPRVHSVVRVAAATAAQDAAEPDANTIPAAPITDAAVLAGGAITASEADVSPAKRSREAAMKVGNDDDDDSDAPDEEPSLRVPPQDTRTDSVDLLGVAGATATESKAARRERRQRERARAARARAEAAKIQSALAPSLMQRVLRGPIVRETTIVLQILRRLVQSRFYEEVKEE